MSTYSLQHDGDGLEQWCSGAFLNQFPAYEEFWLASVVPVTNRPANIHTKSDADLAAAGKSHEDVCISQLHYTVLRHLAYCWQTRGQAELVQELFTNYMIRLSSALDPADEILQRVKTPGVYGPWSDDDGNKARRRWRTAAGSPTVATKTVRDYRNNLLHGRILPGITLTDHAGQIQQIQAVELTRQDQYLDWRNLTAASVTLPHADFEPVGAIMNEAWRVVIDYLESQWRAELL